MRGPSPDPLVVVADDEPDIADLVTLNLSMHGYRVETVYDGVAALEAVRSLLPDAVVLDVMMPKLDGIEVLRRIKADPATCDIPVIMLTARVTDDEVWEGWSAGANLYMTKPFDLEDLLRSLENVIATSAPATAR
jgi:DNA-binding response OmpR family regulator